MDKFSRFYVSICVQSLINLLGLLFISIELKKKYSTFFSRSDLSIILTSVILSGYFRIINDNISHEQKVENSKAFKSKI